MKVSKFYVVIFLFNASIVAMLTHDTQVSTVYTVSPYKYTFFLDFNSVYFPEKLHQPLEDVKRLLKQEDCSLVELHKAVHNLNIESMCSDLVLEGATKIVLCDIDLRTRADFDDRLREQVRMGAQWCKLFGLKNPQMVGPVQKVLQIANAFPGM